MSEIPSASDIQPLPLPKHLIPPPASLLILRDSSCDAMLANAHFSTAQLQLSPLLLLSSRQTYNPLYLRSSICLLYSPCLHHGPYFHYHCNFLNRRCYFYLIHCIHGPGYQPQHGWVERVGHARL
ncbi:hypothetical protein MRB53_032616 [Persea americana]|uniref:Uncharacterized protein n=1 Tax=Persea americana TaxID=3435 RepID=A0ACC2KS86_PERAE|nr:hypothetical protein MRB53_032616 [Persea americana]